MAAAREQRLTSDGGWLTVAGLAWLSPGGNGFGAAAGNPVRLPAHAAPPQAGAFIVENGHVRIEVAPGVAVTCNGKPVTATALRTDAGGADPDVLALGAVTMQVIARGDKLAVGSRTCATRPGRRSKDCDGIRSIRPGG